MITDDGLKQCSRCRLWKAAPDGFHKSKTRPDGFDPQCKACHADKYQRRKEEDPKKVRDQGRKSSTKWRSIHSEAASESARRYEEKRKPGRKRAVERSSLPDGMKRCAACLGVKPLADFVKDQRRTGAAGSYCIPCNAEKSNARNVTYRNRHPDRVRQMVNDRRKTDAAKEWAREWRKLPHVKEVMRQRDQVRVARMRDEDGAKVTRRQWLAIIDAFGGGCCYCGEVCRMTLEHLTPLSRGGRNEVGNIAPACRRCNSGKRDKTLEEYAPERAAEIRSRAFICLAVEPGESDASRSEVAPAAIAAAA